MDFRRRISSRLTVSLVNTRHLSMPKTDQDLLRCFAESHDGGAFAAFVERHLDLVHNVARRRLPPAGVEDVCQEVFRAPARKALQLSRHPAIHAWLFRATVLQAAEHHRRAARQERRRLQIEQHLRLMNDLESAGDGEISEEALRALDECVDALRVKDRELILRRFYRQESFREIGDQLGISENASQKRLDRVVRKLERVMTKQSATLTASVLVAHLAAGSAKAAPVGLAASVTRHALATSLSGASTASGGLGLWLATHLKAAVLTGLAGFAFPLGTAWVSARKLDVVRPPSFPQPQGELVAVDLLARDPLFAGALDPAERMRRILDLEDEDQRKHEIGFLVRRLKPEELPAALAVLADREPEDLAHLEAFLGSWAGLDAKAALAFVASRLPAYRERYMRPLMKGWTRADPDGAWRYVSTLEHDPVRNYSYSILDLWLQEMSFTDPLKALRLLREVPERLRDHHFTQLFANWPEERLDPAIAAIAGIENEDQARLALEALSQSPHVTVKKSFIDAITQGLPESLVDRNMGNLLARWIVAEPEGAIDYVKGLSDPTHRIEQTKRMLTKVDSDRGKVFEVLQSAFPESVDVFLEKQFQAWLIADGKGAVEAFETLRPKQQALVGKFAGSYYAQRLADSSYEVGMSLTDSDARLAFFAGYIDATVKNDLPSALTKILGTGT